MSLPLNTPLQKLFRFVFLLLAVPVSCYAFGHFWIHADSSDQLVVKFRSLHALLVYGHFVGGGFALLLGALQLWTKRPSSLHRWFGFGYCLAVLVSALGGLYLSVHAQLGSIAGLGFFIANLLWLYTTATALAWVLKRNIAAHRRWILRSLALTSAAISLRVLLPLLDLVLSYETSYLLIAWLSWGLNLFAIEIYLRYSHSKKHLASGALIS